MGLKKEDIFLLPVVLIAYLYISPLGELVHALIGMSYTVILQYFTVHRTCGTITSFGHAYALRESLIWGIPIFWVLVLIVWVFLKLTRAISGF